MSIEHFPQSQQGYHPSSSPEQLPSQHQHESSNYNVNNQLKSYNYQHGSSIWQNNYSGTSQYAMNSGSSFNFNMESSTYNNFSGKNSSSNPDAYYNKNDTRNDISKSLKDEIQLKTDQLKVLKNELLKLKKKFDKGLYYRQTGYEYDKLDKLNEDKSTTPQTVDSVFKRLSSTLQKKEKELIEVRWQFESVLTALALDPENPMQNYGEYDTEALSRKTVLYIENLTRENQEVANSLSFTNSKKGLLELQLQIKENNELKLQLQKLRDSQSD